MAKTTAVTRPFDPLSSDDLKSLGDQVLEGASELLTDEQLLTLILAQGRNAPRLQQRLADTFADSLLPLLSTAPDEWAQEGYSDTQATTLTLLHELACRLAEVKATRTTPHRREHFLSSQCTSKLRLGDPRAMARWLGLRYWGPGQEALGAVFLDSRQACIAEEILFRGTVSRILVESQPILRRAITLRARAVILFHTHPSGDPTPSVEDVEFTRHFQKAAELVGIPLIDHLILGGPGDFVSLSDRGLLDRS